MIAPTEFTAAASIKTGLHRPPDCMTNSAVSGPQIIAGIVALNIFKIKK